MTNVQMARNKFQDELATGNKNAHMYQEESFLGNLIANLFLLQKKGRGYVS